MTEFKTDVTKDTYELTFITDNKRNYEYMQESARRCVDSLLEVYSEEFGHIPTILKAIEHCKNPQSSCSGCPYGEEQVKECFSSRDFTLKTLQYFLEKLDETLAELQLEQLRRKEAEEKLNEVVNKCQSSNQL